MESNKQKIKEEIKGLDKVSQNKSDFGINISSQLQEISSLPYNQEFIDNFQELYFLPQISLDNYKKIAGMWDSLSIGLGDNMLPNYIDDDQIRYRAHLLARLEENLENSVSYNEKEKTKEYTKSILDFGARRCR